MEGLCLQRQNKTKYKVGSMKFTFKKAEDCVETQMNGTWNISSGRQAMTQSGNKRRKWL
jgi:hypothetical protein